MEPTLTPQPKSNPWIVPFSIIVAGALVGTGVYFSGTNPKRTLNQEQMKQAGVETVNLRPVSSKEHILGNPNAPVVIVEYSDTECPFCKQFHETMKRVMNEYGKDGKVAWVYRHMPIDGLHKKARKEAEASECAAELGGNSKFWDYVDQIYSRTNSNDSLDPAELPKIAKDIKLDEKKFNECLESGRMAKIVSEDVLDGTNAGARGTPQSVLITRTGEKVSIKGAQPFDVLKAVIDAALAQQQ